MQTTPKRTTGWVVMETLRGYGIDTVFGIPGTHNLEFYRPLGELGIRPVTTRHEQGARCRRLVAADRQTRRGHHDERPRPAERPLHGEAPPTASHAP